MQLYFIRHGQSANNRLWDETGSSKGRSVDAELTEAGRKQAELVARFLRRSHPPDATLKEHDCYNAAGFGITHLYSSLMVRSVATGSLIAETLDLPLVAWKDLHEVGGVYREDEQTGERVGLPGHTRAYFEVHYPRLALGDPDAFEVGWWNRPPETPEQASVRAQRFLHDLMERHGKNDDRVAVISHGAFYNTLLRAILKMPDEANCWFMLNNASISRFDFRDDHIELTYLNRLDHLPPDLVT
jgi:2,3-bisphosphoglycerate-dependent phosphoglycerate mutase